MSCFLFLSLLSSTALGIIIENNNCLSHVSMDTIIDLSAEFDTFVVYLCTFPAYLSPFPACSLFTATSSTQLEDLSFPDNQRAAGHRGSVRKHNTAGRTNDDLKGILWINLLVKSACKYRCVTYTVCTSLMSLHVQKLYSSTLQK